MLLLSLLWLRGQLSVVLPKRVGGPGFGLLIMCLLLRLWCRCWGAATAAGWAGAEAAALWGSSCATLRLS